MHRTKGLWRRSAERLASAQRCRFPRMSKPKEPELTAMKARQLIEGRSFDPTQLKLISKAFDGAWEQIAPRS